MCLLSVRYKGHQQPGGTVLQVAVEESALRRRRPHHGVDAVLMAHGQQALHLARIHRPVFEIEPDGIEPAVGGMADVERQIVPESDDAGATVIADSCQDFA